ncbi:MAG TPA: methyl-accepting chemotaxis protein [Tissierellaceae bacterium]
MKTKSITTKISIFFGILIFIICMGLGAFAYIEASDALRSKIDEDLVELAVANAKFITEKINTQFNALESLANSPWINSDQFSLQEKLKFLQNEVERSGHKTLMIVDTNGIATNTTGEVVDVSERDYFKKALLGENAVTDPMISKTDGSVVVVFAVPIKQGNKVTGVLVARRDGNELSNYTKEMEFNQHQVFMVNNEGTVIASEVTSDVMEMYNFFKAYETDPGLEELCNLVKKMNAGEKGVGEYTQNGVTKYMGYSPVEGTNWSLAITAPKSVVMAKINSLTKVMIGLSVIFLLVGVAITIILSSKITQPIKEASNYLNIMATGDFTIEIPEKLLKKEDEVGNLANSLEKMQSSLRNMIKTIVEEFTNVGHMLNEINNNMFSLNESIEEISATTEQLSASTEETAASTEEMNATSLELEKAIEVVATKAQEGSLTINKVSKLSEDMKLSSISSKEKALEIYSRTKANLENAIEQSKAVNQINELSNTILSITEQTNLLALNAAIEAARAGDAGRGFAVVADEIRKLSENSRSSVTKIQDMISEVIAVVNALSTSSEEIIDFIDKKVLNDYESVVQNSEQYNELSNTINDIVTEFSAISQELLSSVQNLVQAINQIAASSNEEAAGVANIAERASSIVNMTEKVVDLTNKSNKESHSLIELVKQFKI